jgi:hypothetical protein
MHLGWQDYAACGTMIMFQSHAFACAIVSDRCGLRAWIACEMGNPTSPRGPERATRFLTVAFCTSHPSREKSHILTH